MGRDDSDEKIPVVGVDFYSRVVKPRSKVDMPFAERSLKNFANGSKTTLKGGWKSVGTPTQVSQFHDGASIFDLPPMPPLQPFASFSLAPPQVTARAPPARMARAARTCAIARAPWHVTPS